jgi:hypothetical protein
MKLLTRVICSFYPQHFVAHFELTLFELYSIQQNGNLWDPLLYSSSVFYSDVIGFCVGFKAFSPMEFFILTDL